METTSNQVGGNTSNQPDMTQISTGMTSTASGGDLLSADDTLRSYVEEMLITDKRFKGMSRYVFDISFYWVSAIPTACAGHGFIFFNPQWWDQLAHEERKTVIAHEIWHLILNHLERGKEKDPESYNIAGDHVINLTCDEDGFVTTLRGGAPTDFGGKGMQIDERFRGMGTDAIYAIVHKERKKDPNSHGSSGAPSTDQIEDLVKQALEGTGKDLQQQIQENEQERQEAVKNGKLAGDQPGGTQEILRTEGKTVWIKKASYEEIFEDYLTDPLSGGKRTFMRPSRRERKGELRLKGKYPKRGRKNRLTHLVYALDVSGSITSTQKRQFLASAKTLKEKLNPTLMTVILWDTQIQFEKVFREDETLDNIHVMSGGGTSLHPVYKRVAEINPEALVIFTDLCVSIPPKPDWETIWFVPDENVYDGYLDAVTYGEVYLIPEK
jgi:predicted metal-dependent peptidase